MDGLATYLDWKHAGIFAYLFACGVGFPGAEEIALLAGGLIVHSQIWSEGAEAGLAWGTTVLVCLTGILAGDVTLFWLGRRYGRRIRLLRPFRRALRPRRMRRVREFFHRYGSKAVFIARFLPGIRAATFFTAGWTGMRAWQFFLWNGLAAILSVPLGVWIGYFFGENAESLLRRVDVTIGAFLLLAFVALLLWKYFRSRRTPEAPVPPPS
ncbi:MAG TPA: DedA family protein [Planctomycetota bacterium]|jgi:membrane protein DedA with SNARE-associated domain|nr:DedA family protein [Planctomycetota bacterium]